jgi:sulfite reductase (NADPH) flavoprotein alpha-component
LAEARKGITLAYSIGKGTLRLPKSGATPLILVGPGTGIAPFRAFVQERRLSQAAGDILVFFGCRSLEADFFYRPEWDKAVQTGEVDLDVAASRDQEEKVYVQHRIVSRAVDVWRLLEGGAIVYICGYGFMVTTSEADWLRRSSAQMPKGVRQAFKTVARQEGGMDEADAERFLSNLEGSGRLMEETWG